MEVLVLGSGVVGLTSAWYLAQAGHDVTVVDRQPRSAEETSFANAGKSPMATLPLGCAGHSAKSSKMDAGRTCTTQNPTLA